MPSDGTIGGLVGKLHVLRIECPTCGPPRSLSGPRGARARSPAHGLAERAHRRLSAKGSSRSHARMRRGHAGFGRFAV